MSIVNLPGAMSNFFKKNFGQVNALLLFLQNRLAIGWRSPVETVAREEFLFYRNVETQPKQRFNRAVNDPLKQSRTIFQNPA